MSERGFGIDHHTTAPADDASGEEECDECGSGYDAGPEELKCDDGLCPSCSGGDLS